MGVVDDLAAPSRDLVDLLGHLGRGEAGPAARLEPARDHLPFPEKIPTRILADAALVTDEPGQVRVTPDIEAADTLLAALPLGAELRDRARHPPHGLLEGGRQAPGLVGHVGQGLRVLRVREPVHGLQVVALGLGERLLDPVLIELRAFGCHTDGRGHARGRRGGLGLRDRFRQEAIESGPAPLEEAVRDRAPAPQLADELLDPARRRAVPCLPRHLADVLTEDRHREHVLLALRLALARGRTVQLPHPLLEQVGARAQLPVARIAGVLGGRGGRLSGPDRLPEGLRDPGPDRIWDRRLDYRTWRHRGARDPRGTTGTEPLDPRLGRLVHVHGRHNPCRSDGRGR